MTDSSAQSKTCHRCGNSLSDRARFCPSCGAQLIAPKAETKHSDLQSTDVPSRSREESPALGRVVFMVIAVVALIGGGIAFFNSLPFHPHPVIEQQPIVAEAVSYGDSRTDMVQIASRVEDGKITISLQDVLDARMVGFDYEGGTAPISLVAFVSPEGRLVTSIAFCEPCNSKRYHAQNNTLICNSCGTTWKMENLEGISGSCQKYPPDPLPSVIVGDEVHIDEQAVKNTVSGDDSGAAVESG